MGIIMSQAFQASSAGGHYVNVQSISATYDLSEDCFISFWMSVSFAVIEGFGKKRGDQLLLITGMAAVTTTGPPCSSQEVLAPAITSVVPRRERCNSSAKESFCFYHN